ncbi:hypothetical protein BU24DRAFT_264542 [Aaosphaeria arxii CBS 175.79]|uniref:Uncharacterized protein n=1 Tax=Aaosphaeria arxii CBS 175.79 TaxID=1450172 RepID=A0A6A5XG90_9PLEO|nr:uncharacterized protein BU24DRAFT_264542 [Aaosphaeria arxii CBS 175.79]KAF2011847.1 hypothetical protein BU24DRAFT_264542 [Aaosphaeria arxii CBS 175.79]
MIVTQSYIIPSASFINAIHFSHQAGLRRFRIYSMTFSRCRTPKSASYHVITPHTPRHSASRLHPIRHRQPPLPHPLNSTTFTFQVPEMSKYERTPQI